MARTVGIVLAMSQFDEPDDIVDEDDPGGLPPLPMAPDAAAAVTASLRAAGVEVIGGSPHVDLDCSSFHGVVERALAEATKTGQPVVMHVVSHGQQHKTSGHVRVVTRQHTLDDTAKPVCGVCGKGARGWDVQTNVRDLEEEDGPPVLLLLDICEAGGAVDLSLMPQVDRRVWVVGASEPLQPAFGCRLSTAVAEVLQRAANGLLDISKQKEHVTTTELFAEFERTVDRLQQAAGDAATQRVFVTASNTYDLPGFIDNPAFDPDRRVADTELEQAGPGVAELVGALDAGWDATHFVTRAAGLPDDSTAEVDQLLFSGRDQLLRNLAGWLTTPDSDGLGVVTGSPGAGKSAILGVVTAATHPDLTTIRQRLPSATGDLFAAGRGGQVAAVHARDLTHMQVIEQLATQLQLEPPEGGWTAEALRHALVDLADDDGGRPLLIVDAVDEAHDPQALLELLLPLSTVEPSGEMPWRLLVGTRPAGMRRLLEAAGWSHDLDDEIGTAALQDAVGSYVAGYLTATTGLPQQQRADIAGTVSGVLAGPDALPPEQAGAGAFLLASLLLHDLTSRDHKDLTGQRLEVPTTVADALQLHLDHVRTRWTQPVLQALAFAKGQGMPAHLAAPVAAALDDVGGLSPDVDVVLDVIGRSRRYLRADADPTSGRQTYRPYHTRIAELLRSRAGADAAATVTHALLDTVDVQHGRQRWDLADPYLLRHVAAHAEDARLTDRLLADPEALVYVDLVHADRYAAGTPDARGGQLLLRVANGIVLTDTSEQRRQHLEMTARRLSLHDLAGRLATDETIMSRTRWMTGGDLNPALLRTLTGPATLVESVAVGQVDGRSVIFTGSRDGAVRVWDLDTGRTLHTLTGHTDVVTSVAVGQIDGRPAVASGSSDGTVRMWDLETRQTLHTLASNGGPVQSVAIGRIASGPVIVSGYRDGAVRVWDPGTGNAVHTLRGHDGGSSVALGQVGDRRVIVSGSYDGTVRVWDPETGQPLHIITGHDDWVNENWVMSVAIGQSGDRPAIVFGSTDGTVRVWDPGETLHTMTGHSDWVNSVAGGRIGDQPVIVSGSSDGAVRVWDPDTGQTIRTLTSHEGPVESVAVGQIDGRSVVVSVSWHGAVLVWDPDAVQTLHTLTGHGSTVSSVAVEQVYGRPVVVSGSEDGEVRVWDPDTGQTLRTLTGHDGPVASVAVGLVSGRRVIASGGRDETVRVSDHDTGQALHTLVNPRLERVRSWLRRLRRPTARFDLRVWSVAVGEITDGPVVVSGRHDGTVRVWEAGTGQIRHTLTGHKGRVTSLALGQLDGRPAIVSGSHDRTVRVWDADTGTTLHTLTGHDGPVTSVALGQLDGRLVILSGGRDETVRVWDPDTGRTLHTLTGHTDVVTSVAVGQIDGRPVIVSGSDDGTARVWGGSSRWGRSSSIVAGRPVIVAVGAGLVAMGVGSDVAVLEPRGRAARQIP